MGLNLDPVPEMQLNDNSIYDYKVCTVLTEVNPTLNLDTFAVAFKSHLNLGSFIIYIRYLSTGEQKGVSVEKLDAKWIINLGTDKATLDVTIQLLIGSSENLSFA